MVAVREVIGPECSNFQLATFVRIACSGILPFPLKCIIGLPSALFEAGLELSFLRLLKVNDFQFKEGGTWC